MAIEPFRRKIASPNAAPLVPFRPVQMPDIGGDITRAALGIYGAMEPGFQQKAVSKAEADAAKALVRDENGNLITEAPDKKGGLIYQEAYNKLLKSKYLAEFSLDLQTHIDKLQTDITLGENPTDKTKPDKFLELGLAYIDGALSKVPEEFRAEATELALREGQERFRSFRSGWTNDMERSLVNGTMLTLKNLKKLHEDGVEAGLPKEQLDPIQRKIYQLSADLKNYAISNIHRKAIIDEIFGEIGDAEDFANATANSTALTNALPGVEDAGLEVLINWGNGVADDSVVSIKLDNLQVSLPVVEGSLLNAVKSKFQISDAEDPLETGSDRDLTDPTMLNIRPIDGVSYDQFIKTITEAGFTILESRDESTPEEQQKYGNSRPNWFVTVGPRYETTGDGPGDKFTQLDFEQFNKLFPSKVVRSEVAQLANRSLSNRRRERAEAEARLRHSQMLAELRENRKVLEDNARNGIANLSPTQKNILDESFKDLFKGNLANIATPQGLQIAKSFLQQHSYTPLGLRAWFTSYLRNEKTYKIALTFYNNVKNIRTNAQFLMGDVLIGELSDRDQAIAHRMLEVHNSGASDAVQQKQILSILEGKDYSVNDFKAQLAPGKFNNDMRSFFTSTFKIKSGNVIPPELIRRYESAVEANLGAYGGDYEKALRATQSQMASVLVANPLFQGGVGYKSLFTRWSGGDVKVFNTALALFLNEYVSGANGRYNFMVTSKGPDGKLAKAFVGGENTSLKVSVIDDNVANPRRLRITVYNPVTKTPVETKDITLGQDFATKIKQARTQVYGQRKQEIQTNAGTIERIITQPWF